MLEHIATNRRKFLRGTLSTALNVVLGTLIVSSCRKQDTEEDSPTPGTQVVPSSQQDASRPSLALSLTVLQEEVMRQRQPLPDTLAHLGGMNRVQGFMIEDGEIVLLGARDPDPSLPLVDLETLVIALRNAFQVSPSYQGVIGCSIDPWAGSKDPWRIQQVRVFSMPATKMAYRHVSIDFELKKVSSGVLSLGEGIPSLYQMTRSASPLCEGSLNKEEETEATHRFWFYTFYPPSPRFMTEEGIVLILKPVGVQLLTEQEFLDRAGKRTGAAPASPLATRFAQVITELLASNQMSHYAQLRQDFRVIEVAQLLRFKRVPAQSLRYFLQDYTLTEVEIPRFVGGIRREERGEVVCDSQIIEKQVLQGKLIESTERVKRYHFISRGGVEANIHLAPEHFVEERSGVLADLRRRVRASRPSVRALLWSIEY